MSPSKCLQNGFTMIELIVVIVILAILGAMALPKFVDLRSDALQSSASGVAAQLSEAMSVNYSGCEAHAHAVTANKCQAVSNCSDGLNLLAGGALPTTGNTTYSITAAALGSGAPGANGVTGACTLTATSGATNLTTTFRGMSAGL